MLRSRSGFEVEKLLGWAGHIWPDTPLIINGFLASRDEKIPQYPKEPKLPGFGWVIGLDLSQTTTTPRAPLYRAVLINCLTDGWMDWIGSITDHYYS